MEIIPSIIATEFEEVRTKIKRLEGLVNWAELDICDGVFVPNLTWPVVKGGQAPEDLKEVDGKIKISAHLMTEYPETLIDDHRHGGASWRDVADRLVVHYESTNNLEKIIELGGVPRGSEATLRGPSIVIALELNTPVEKIFEYLGHVKTVQLMSIERLGFAGEKFDERVFEKIKTLKTNWPDVKIIVDGGVDLEIAKKLKELGVSGVVVGSRIWQAKNIEEAINNFKSL